MPLVINRHHHQDGLPRGSLYVGRGTPLGNPFKLAEYPDALDRYRRWLYRKIRHGDLDVLAAMREVDHETLLVCSCAPRPCHAYVIEDAWWWMLETGLLFGDDYEASSASA